MRRLAGALHKAVIHATFSVPSWDRSDTYIIVPANSILPKLKSIEPPV